MKAYQLTDHKEIGIALTEETIENLIREYYSTLFNVSFLEVVKIELPLIHFNVLCYGRIIDSRVLSVDTLSVF